MLKATKAIINFHGEGSSICPEGLHYILFFVNDVGTKSKVLRPNISVFKNFVSGC